MSHLEMSRSLESCANIPRVHSSRFPEVKEYPIRRESLSKIVSSVRPIELCFCTVQVEVVVVSSSSFFWEKREALVDDANLCEIRRFQELRSDGRDGEIGGDGIIGEAPDITELLSLLMRIEFSSL